MIKWLFVLGVIAVVYFMFIKKSVPQKTKSDQDTKPPQGDVEEMVECSRCGIYVEIDEAILSNGKYYCSKECLKG